MWVSNVLGHHDRRCWEISICKEDHRAGIVQYGSFGREKLLISHDNDRTLVEKDVWDGLVALAGHFAEFMNKKEKIEADNLGK